MANEDPLQAADTLINCVGELNFQLIDTLRRLKHKENEPSIQVIVKKEKSSFEKIHQSLCPPMLCPVKHEKNSSNTNGNKCVAENYSFLPLQYPDDTMLAALDFIVNFF
jgi:hypothetical protein